MKYRWGSYTSYGNLNFHWKTVLTPVPIVDYVIVNELVHLKEKNHTPKFWEIVAAVLPDYEKRKEGMIEGEWELFEGFVLFINDPGRRFAKVRDIRPTLVFLFILKVF